MAGQKRTYRKRLRADGEAQTRMRITESAVALHGSVGPARTSVAAVASHAGVRRSTVYRHFPDEASLFKACSAHWMSLHPPPDVAAWAAVDDRDERVRAALSELYGWYRGNEQMLYNLHRDEATMDVVRDRFRGFRDLLAAAGEILMRGHPSRGRARARVRAAVGHALAYGTWRSLALEQGLADAQAVDLMVRLISAAASGERAQADPSAGGQRSPSW
jgi:AcrR family transcriptional regulator